VRLFPLRASPGTIQFFSPSVITIIFFFFCSFLQYLVKPPGVIPDLLLWGWKRRFLSTAVVSRREPAFLSCPYIRDGGFLEYPYHSYIERLSATYSMACLIHIRPFFFSDSARVHDFLLLAFLHSFRFHGVAPPKKLYRSLGGWRVFFCRSSFRLPREFDGSCPRLVSSPDTLLFF